MRSPLRSRRRRLSNHRAAKCDLLTLHAPFGPTDDVRDHLLRIACDRPRRWHASDGNPRTQNHDESAISEKGQKAKYSLRANDVRSGPDNGHTATAAACRVRANDGQCTAAVTVHRLGVLDGTLSQSQSSMRGAYRTELRSDAGADPARPKSPRSVA